MSFNNSAVFNFPAVQYIPMRITTIHQGHLNQNPAQGFLPQIIAGEEVSRWNHLLTNHGITLSKYLPPDAFPILALHLSVNDVKYRGFFVTMTGAKNYGEFQLFTIPKHYFYKNKLCFELFDEQSGEPLAKYSLFMPKV